jgi:hypothetical protein
MLRRSFFSLRLMLDDDPGVGQALAYPLCHLHGQCPTLLQRHLAQPIRQRARHVDLVPLAQSSTRQMWATISGSVRQSSRSRAASDRYGKVRPPLAPARQGSEATGCGARRSARRPSLAGCDATVSRRSAPRWTAQRARASRRRRAPYRRHSRAIGARNAFRPSACRYGPTAPR